MNPNTKESGFALATALMLMALLMAVLVAYFLVTRVEQSTTRSSMDQTRGFYAAEAGLNIRAEAIRSTFAGYNLPSGTAPTTGSGQLPCATGDPGSGDFACETYAFEGRNIRTHVVQDPTNPRTLVVPRGEPFQNLVALEYAFDVVSSSSGTREDLPEAVLEMQFRSRLIPMFQFAVFYNKDLEILPGPDMSLSGPVHANGDLYLDVSGLRTLTIDGQTTTAGALYRGRKDVDSCGGGAVEIYDPSSPRELPGCGGVRTEIPNASVTDFNGMVRSEVDAVTVPEPEVFDPMAGSLYWDRADLRVVLDVDNPATPTIEVRLPDNSVDAGRTASLNACTLGGDPVVAASNSFYNNREGELIDMLDVDVEGLLECIHDNDLQNGRGIDDVTEGGLVWYFTVEGPDSDTLNNYGVRVKNGANIKANDAAAPAVAGLTIVTDQATYLQGDYNSTDKKPAAFLADSVNVLSNAWSDANSWVVDPDLPAGGYAPGLASRVASSTVVNAAFLSGTDVTGGTEGPGGWNGPYNGGLENYPRFHESWTGQTLQYRGSFVSLYEAEHANGPWSYGDPVYEAPIRDWGFDMDFNDPAKLPPLSPRFVYLRQDLFVRQFEL